MILDLWAILIYRMISAAVLFYADPRSLEMFVAESVLAHRVPRWLFMHQKSRLAPRIH